MEVKVEFIKQKLIPLINMPVGYIYIYIYIYVCIESILGEIREKLNNDGSQIIVME